MLLLSSNANNSSKASSSNFNSNYLSQYFANLYLSELDHLCKEELKCKFYYRYADDIVILSDDKDFLHKVLIYIKLYVHTIGLKVKDNYQIYPVDSKRI